MVTCIGRAFVDTPIMANKARMTTIPTTARVTNVRIVGCRPQLLVEAVPHFGHRLGEVNLDASVVDERIVHFEKRLYSLNLLARAKLENSTIL